MKKIYFVTGLGGSGKTTFAKKMAEELGVAYYKADDVYEIVQRKLEIPITELSKMAMLQTWKTRKDWGVYETPERLLETSYNELFSYNPPKVLILEGESLFFNPREFGVVDKMFKDYDRRYLVLEPDYETWLKFRAKRRNISGEITTIFREEKDFYNLQAELRQYVPLKNQMIIKDPLNYQCSNTGNTEYQNDEFSGPKWEAFNLKDLEGKSFFEVSCNTGYFSNKAKEQGARIFGLDISWQVLDKAMDKVPDGNFFLSKIEDYEFQDIYDFILCSSAFHYYKHREEMIKKISEHCKTFLLELPVKGGGDDIYYQGGDNCDFCSVVSQSLIEKWLKKYFKSVEMKGYTKQPNSSDRPIYLCQQ